MRLAAAVKLGVNVRIDIVDVATGRVRRRLQGHNLVTTAGLAKLALGLTGVAPTVTHFGLGSSNTAPSAGDTALGAEIIRPGVTNVSAAAAVATAQYYLGSGQQNGQTFREAGLFIGSTLFARFVFSDPDLAPKTSATAAVFSWAITHVAV